MRKAANDFALVCIYQGTTFTVYNARLCFFSIYNVLFALASHYGALW